MKQSAAALRLKLRELLRQPGIQLAPGCYDSMSSRLVEDAGFDIVYATGQGMSRSMGFPDVGLVTMSEVVERLTQICRTIDIPLVADADTAYGNAINAARTVQEFERAGVAGLHIEDQVAPKRCGHLASAGLKKEVVAQAEHAGKIRAAIDARTDPNTVIIARCDARAAGEPMEGVLERAEAYLEAGADLILPTDLRSPEEYARLAETTQGRCMAIPPASSGGGWKRSGQSGVDVLADLDAGTLAGMGYKLAIAPGSVAMAAVAGMRDLLATMRAEGADRSHIQKVSRPDEVWRWYYLSLVDQFREAEEKYLSV